MPLRAMFVDMNCFFASVEQQLRPELRGRPVAVAAVDVDSTSCIAVSYEARRWGSIAGCRAIGEAQRHAGMTIVEARPAKYVEFHHKIIKVVNTCLPVHKTESIDEFSCRLGSNHAVPAVAVELARRVKRVIHEQVGESVKCSIGLAPNRFLAKVASDMQKPDGLVVLHETDLPRALYPLALEDLAGVGPRMLVRLEAAGVTTVEGLYQLSEMQMKKIWGGVVGQRWWHLLRGHDVFEPPTRKSTVGHSHVLPPELRNEEGAEAVLLRLVHKAAARLRRMNYWAGRMEVYVSFSFREQGWSGSIALGSCKDTLTMIEAFYELWRHHPRLGRPTQVAITLYDLVPHLSATMPLFQHSRQRITLSHAMDQLNEKFGSNSVYFAGIHDVQHAAPTRIAFTQIPDVMDG